MLERPGGHRGLALGGQLVNAFEDLDRLSGQATVQVGVVFITDLARGAVLFEIAQRRHHHAVTGLHLDLDAGPGHDALGVGGSSAPERPTDPERGGDPEKSDGNERGSHQTTSTPGEAGDSGNGPVLDGERCFESLALPGIGQDADVGTAEEQQATEPDEVDHRVDEDAERRLARLGVDAERNHVEILTEDVGTERGETRVDADLGRGRLDLAPVELLESRNQLVDRLDRLGRVGRVVGVDLLGHHERLAQLRDLHVRMEALFRADTTQLLAAALAVGGQVRDGCDVIVDRLELVIVVTDQVAGDLEELSGDQGSGHLELVGR